MENDSVRTIGETTLVDMWIDGKLRAISVSREAIAAFLRLPPASAAAISEDERREFVRTNLTLVAKAVTEWLRTNPAAESVTIDAEQIVSRAGVRTADRSGERRQSDRRKGDRRTANLGPPPSGERRS